MNSLINKNQVFLNKNFSTQEEVFHFLAKKSVELEIADNEKQVFDSFVEREKLDTTGFENGIAIPHAKSKAIKNSQIIYIRNHNDKLQWESLDGKPITDLIVLFIPEEAAGTDHLKILSAVATKLTDEKFVEKLKKSDVASKIVELLNISLEEKKSEKTKKSDGDDNSDPKKKKKILVGITACMAGIAHTYMAKQKLENAAKELGYEAHIETQGSVGVEDELDPQTILDADLVILAADIKINPFRFNGKKLYSCTTNKMIKDPIKTLKEAEKTAQIQGGAGQKVGALRIGSTRNSGDFFRAISSGISYLIPFAVMAGLFIGVANIFVNTGATSTGATFFFWPDNAWGTVLRALSQTGGLGFLLMIPVFGGFIAFAIGDKAAIVPAMIGSFLLNNPPIGVTNNASGVPVQQFYLEVFAPGATNLSFTGSAIAGGFVGAILMGFIIGYIVKMINQLKWPKVMKPILPFIIIPFFVGFIAFALATFVFGLPILYLVVGINQLLNALATPALAILAGIIFAAFIALDLGGPFNKTALVVATVIFLSSLQTGGVDGVIAGPQTAVQSAISVPPLAMFVATVINPSKFSKEEKVAGKAALGMGLFGVSEGAIPFAAADPLRVIPANVIGASVAGFLTTLLGIQFFAGLGSPLGAFIGSLNPGQDFGSFQVLWILSILVGITVTASIVLLLKPVNKEYIAEHQISVAKRREMFSEMGVVTKSQYFKYYLHKLVTYPFASVYSSVKTFHKLDSRKYDEYKKLNLEIKTADKTAEREWRQSIVSLKQQCKKLRFENKKENQKYNLEVKKYIAKNKENFVVLKKELKSKIHNLKSNSSKTTVVLEKNQLLSLFYKKYDLRRSKITILKTSLYKNIQSIKAQQEAEIASIKEKVMNSKNNFKKLIKSTDEKERTFANNEYKLIKRLQAEIKTTKKTHKKDTIIKDTVKKARLEIKFIDQPQYSNILDNFDERKLATEKKENNLKKHYLKLYEYDKQHNISFYKIRKSIWFLSYAGFLLSFGTIMLSVLFWILSGLPVPPIQSSAVVLTSVLYLGLTPFILIANRTLLYNALDDDQKLITLNRKLFWYGIVGMITLNIPGLYNGIVNSRRIKKIQKYVATA